MSRMQTLIVREVFLPKVRKLGSLTGDYPGLNPITIENRQIKEELSYPLTKSASASVPNNSVIAPVVKPGMPVARFNSLG